MARFTADYRQLDDATRDYLKEIAAVKGANAPGIFVPNPAGCLSVINIILGLAILYFGLDWAVARPKNIWATAMIVTAVVLLGGWLLLYPIRRALGGGLGDFQYFDPDHAYESVGRDVTVTDLRGFTHPEFQEKRNDNSYVNHTLKFKLPDGRAEFAIANQEKGELTCRFFHAVSTLNEDPNFVQLPGAQRGGIARHIAIHQQMPDEGGDIPLAVSEIPTEPSADRKAAGWLVSLLIVSIAAGAVFASAYFLLGPIKDRQAFEAAQKHGIQGYRDYLLNPRNIAHREEAKAKIKELYQSILQRVSNCPDAAEKQAWTEILSDLAQCESMPVVSLKLTGNCSQPQPVQHYLADSLGSYFGPEYIMFVEPPEGAKPMIECRYDEQPDGSVIWTMTYRRTPEAKAVEIPSRKSPQSTAINLNPPPESFRVQFWRLIFNTTPPGLHQQPAPVTDGDW